MVAGVSPSQPQESSRGVGSVTRARSLPGGRHRLEDNVEQALLSVPAHRGHRPADQPARWPAARPSPSLARCAGHTAAPTQGPAPGTCAAGTASPRTPGDRHATPPPCLGPLREDRPAASGAGHAPAATHLRSEDTPPKDSAPVDIGADSGAYRPDQQAPPAPRCRVRHVPLRGVRACCRPCSEARSAGGRFRPQALPTASARKSFATTASSAFATSHPTT